MLVLGAGQQGEPQQKWLSELRAAKLHDSSRRPAQARGRNTSPSNRRNSSLRKSGTDPSFQRADPYQPTEAELTAEAAWDADFGATLTAARKCVATNKLLQAVSILEGWVARSDGRGDSPMVQLLADVYLRLDQPANALAVCLPLANQFTDPELLLRTSISAAKVGSIYQGQRRFSADYILARWSCISDGTACLRQDNTPSGVEAVTSIALGMAPANVAATAVQILTFFRKASLTQWLGQMPSSWAL